MRFIVRPAAQDDIVSQHRYYLFEEEAEEVAERFLGAIQETILQLLQNPRVGSPRKISNPAMAGLRSWPVRGFPSIRVYYLVTEPLLRIVRVLHGKRDISALLENESSESES